MMRRKVRSHDAPHIFEAASISSLICTTPPITVRRQIGR